MKVLREEERSITNYFLLSLVLHVIGFSMVLLIRNVEVSHTESLRRKNIELLSSSVRVDVVAMPKYTVKELKQMQKDIVSPTPAPKPEKTEISKSKEVPTKEGDVELIKVKKKLSFEEMMKNLSEKKVKKNNKKKNQKLFDSPQKSNDSLSKSARSALKSIVIQGNKISSGSSLTGSESASGSNSEFERYVSSLPDLVRAHWRLPSYLLNKNLRCRIRVFISASGKLIRTEVYESSGDQEYDAKAVEAIAKASPFPRLESSFKGKGINGEILLGFPL